jgi:hypothetical protein
MDEMSIKTRLATTIVKRKVSRITRSFNFWANLLAIALILFIAAIGIMNMDPSWDSQEYHLPFAARLAGIFTKDEYKMRPIVEGYYDGIAKLAEILQGFLWRITGLPGSDNLVGLISLVILIVVSSHLFTIPLWQLTLFYLSIPLVLRHSYSSYVDLAANSFLTLGIISFFSAIMKKDYSIKKLITILIPLAISANIKLYQLVVGVFLAVFIFLFFAFSWIKERVPFKKVMLYFLLFLIFIGAAYWQLGYNYFRFSNPIYPMRFTFKGHVFPGIANASTNTHIIKAFSVLKSNPYYFARSLTEMDLWRVRPETMYTVDMNLGYYNAILSARMGGFFVVNLIFWGVGLIIFALFSQNRAIFKCLVILGTLTITASFLPSSSELRYVTFFPLTLATLFLIGLHDSVRKRWSQVTSIIIQVVIFAFVAFLVVTKSDYFPKALTIEQYKIQAAEQKARYEVDIESPVCIYGDNPEAFYYKLANPALKIEFLQDESDCTYENRIRVEQMPAYRVNP